MSMLLYITEVIVIYVNLFKDDFSEDNIKKLAPLGAIFIVILVLYILFSIIKGG